MKWCLATALWWYSLSPLYADPLGDRLAGFAAETHLQAQFTETWNADYLDEPVVSQGKLEYLSPGILIKQITLPTAVTQTIIGDVVIVNRDGEKEQISLSSNSEMALGIEGLRDLLDGNRPGLESRFSVQYKLVVNQPQAWELRLIPRDKKLSEQISWIDIKGLGNRLHQIHLKYVNGDQMLTRITPHE